MSANIVRLVRLLAASAVVAGSLAGCADRAGIEPLRLDEPDSMGTWGFGPVPGEVLLVGMTPLRVLAPATFESASMEMDTGELELLTTRVSLYACRECPRRPEVGYGGYAGSSCSIGPWPPRGYGPTYALDGFVVQPGDRPSLVLYFRPGTANARTKAVVLTYRDDHGRRRALRIANERVEVKPPDGPLGDNCQDSLWFGGTGNPDTQRVRPLSPTPTR